MSILRRSYEQYEDDLGPSARIGDVMREKIEPVDLGPSVPIADIMVSKQSLEDEGYASIADVIAEKTCEENLGPAIDVGTVIRKKS